MDELPGLVALTASAMDHMRRLAVDLSPRTSATDGELRAAEYILGELRGFGFQAEIKEFTVERLRPEGEYVTIEGLEPRTVTSRIIDGTAQGEVSGPLVFVGLGREEDLPDEGLEGAIALIERGTISFQRKARNVTRAGAIGAIIFNDRPGLFTGTFRSRLEVVAVGISQADGRQFVEAVELGAVTVTLRLVVTVEQSRNVVALKPGGPAGIVVIGGHYDAVPGSPAANDNASGIAVALTIAEQLAGRDLPFELRVIAFGSEELGLLGSRHYVESLAAGEADRILAMLNFDALGAGRLELIGDTELVDPASEIAESEGIDTLPGVQPPGTSSDHAPFAAVGIPVLVFIGNDLSRIHSQRDTVDGVGPELMGSAALIGLKGLLGDLIRTPRAR